MIKKLMDRVADAIAATDNKPDAFKGGQIGFRQMRHTLEASYGGLKIQQVKSKRDTQ